MSQSRRFASALAIPLVLATISAAACGRDAGRRKGDSPIAADTMLARDIALASGDTSSFTEAADIAQGAEADTSADRGDSALAATAPSMRVPDRCTPPAEPGAARPAGATTRAPAAPAPAAPAAPAPRASGTSAPASPTPADRIPLDASCNSPTLPNQRRCLLLYLAKSDVTLDRNYQALITDLKADAGTRPGGKEPPRVTRLRVAQRAWLVYRDTECRRRNRGQEGPLWAPTRARCLAEYSAKRAEELAAARNR